MLSSKLETLRDMTEDSHIDPSSLTKVKDLGAGAFATGKCLWLFGEDSVSLASSGSLLLVITWR